MKTFSTGISLLAAIVLSINVSAQSFNITPDDTLIVTAPSGELSVFDIYQNNTTAGSITLLWESLSSDMPAGWDYSICDFGACYPGLHPGDTMALVEVGGSGFLGVNVIPDQMAAIATVRINVWEINDPGNKVTLTWIIESIPTDVQEVVKPTIQINPSVASAEFSFQIPDFAGAQLTVVNNLGQKILRLNLSAEQGRFNVSNWPSGPYICTVTNYGQLLHSEKLIVVH